MFDKIQLLQQRLESKLIQDITSNRKGVKETQLLNKIDINQFIYPILHSEIGLGNYILKFFFDWIDNKLENISMKIKKLEDSIWSNICRVSRNKRRMVNFQ